MHVLLPNTDYAVRFRRKVTIAGAIGAGMMVGILIEAGQHLG